MTLLAVLVLGVVYGSSARPGLGSAETVAVCVRQVCHLSSAWVCTTWRSAIYREAPDKPTYLMQRSGQNAVDYYETLQISANAEPETIHRVYRLLAQRFHPDNTDTGNDQRFRELAEAYEVLSDPERRAKYDVVHQQFWRERWKVVETTNVDVDFRSEQIARLTVLELLYTRRRTEPQKPSMSILDVEALTGRAREHLEFSIWFLTQKRFVQRGDDSGLTITAEGVEYLENNIDGTIQSRLLRDRNE
jgi:curved DNA-binding protein CbpA